MKVVAIIQARMGSTRLPAKVMRPLAGRPMIHHVVERARRIHRVDQVVVATSYRRQERPLVDYVETVLKAPVIRGPEEDVLQRFVDTALCHRADVIMRLTADCPLLSPRVSADVLHAYLTADGDVDYASNTLVRTYPRGLDTEVFGLDTLKRAHQRATAVEEREHVTLPIYGQPSPFKILHITAPRDYPLYRWTVDTAADLDLVRHIYDALYATHPRFDIGDVLQLLQRHPRWVAINDGVTQKPTRP